VLDHDDLAGGEGSSSWPAFADLLAATTLLFLILFAVIAVPALARNKVLEGQRNTLAHIYESLDSSRRAIDSRYAIEAVGDYVLVTLAGDATFPLDKYDLADLKPEGKAVLRGLAATLNSPAVRDSIDQIQVVGHTSSEGSDEHNWRLSAERAASVALFLIHETGLPACKITALGRGRFYPVDPERARATTEVMPADRRIELEIRPIILSDEGQSARRGHCVERRGVPLPAAR
jgi:outer membrane protein OmpA-like peptidoglycan-associated protein